ncbi:uncharacterized protein LOC142977760 [Anticarsia gemmatalis]|uniref:uncharacterized protein LOC142977760 n=1 Tax=Anticarsia gemmatalis TaxID=129554 RepID=UPI003F7720B1
MNPSYPRDSYTFRYQSTDRGRPDVLLRHKHEKQDSVSGAGTVHKNYPDRLEPLDEEFRIEWSNLIFLPFHPVFKLLVLASVILKTTLGPLQSVYPILYCSSFMDSHIILQMTKNYYWYFADIIYSIDTLLHITHRQVTDKAMRREHLPKSAFLLLLDLLSLIPFFRLFVQEFCPPAQLWPNVLAYSEFLVIYRIWEYFELMTTHSYTKMVLGFTLVSIISVNCVSTFWILLTYHGLCANCGKNNLDYDWRVFVLYKINETDSEVSTYIYATTFVATHLLRLMLDETLPSTILEFVLISLFMIVSYVIVNVIVIPKAFAESMLRLRRVCSKYPAVQKIIGETRRRNSSLRAYKHVETYYTTMWKRRSGIVYMPEILEEIPRYLRLEIKQDLLWPLFYHSPTLRKTSNSFKRWLCESMSMSYKLPGEKFYGGSQCLSNLYYLKSGVVQLISADDGITPILSVTSGTILGDVNFLLPHRKRKVALRCLTYCELYYLTRDNLLKALHRFPEDRKIVMNSYIDRLNHAITLFACKRQLRGLDRNEDEGIAWIKARWWEIFNFINIYKKSSAERESQNYSARCELPRETSVYHCAKYLGQLVLCTDAQLQTKSMFVNDHFPWIISPYSAFSSVWKKIVIYAVIVTLCTTPVHITIEYSPDWLLFVLVWTDVIYAADICVSLSTAVTIQENETPNFATVMFERCKSLNFILDILSALWLERIVITIQKPELFYTVQFNRLIKIYILFSSDYDKWNIRKNPMVDVCRKIILLHFSFTVIMSHIVCVINMDYQEITTEYFFGATLCSYANETNCEPVSAFLGVTLPWTYELIFPEFLPLKQIDVLIAIVVNYFAYIIYAYSKGRFLSYLYLKYRDATNYEYFVLNLKRFYEHYGIHKDLLKRLERYLICQYKYYKGIDVLHPNDFKHEPFQIFWKVQGEVAEKIISDSKAFSHADPALIRELACASNYIIIPRKTILYLFGTQCKNVTWVAQGYIKSESHDENGNVVVKHYQPGDMLSMGSVFFGKVAIKTYIAHTECEILYIKTKDFFDIYKRYPVEWFFLDNCITEFKSEIDEVFRKFIIEYKSYQSKLRSKMYTKKSSLASVSYSEKSDMNAKNFEEQRRSSPFEGTFWGLPESGFMQSWLLFRTIAAFISILNASLTATSGGRSCWYFVLVMTFCDSIAWIDIVLKAALAYYDHRGVIITDKFRCLVNYLTRGFLTDFIGAMPWYSLIRAILYAELSSGAVLNINTACKFTQIYILFSYFNYVSDMPTILKWQVVNVLSMIAASQYLMTSCVDYLYEGTDLVNATLQKYCWVPKIFNLSEGLLDDDSLHLLFAQSIHLAECGMLRINHGDFIIERTNYSLFAILFALGLIFWFITCYTLTILVLSFRGNTLFQHGVATLHNYLKNERVEGDIINKVITHFTYCWRRTKGINVQHIRNERIGVVFRQDLTYFFYKKTYALLDTLIKGGENIQRQLASVSMNQYFLPGHEIMREMDLVPNVFVVHRGKVLLKKDGHKIITLCKGDIFGQLIGRTLRPVMISAEAEGRADVLQLTVKAFQDIITDEVRETIAKHPHSKNNFMATKVMVTENPYDTIEYVLRGKKAIQLPWMFVPTESHRNSWYARWLQLTWFILPSLTALIVIILPWQALPPHIVHVLYYILIAFDVLHLANFIAEFYTTELTVVNNKCVYRITGLGVFWRWGFYLDVLSLVIPLFTFLDYDPKFQLAKLLRLKMFIDFYKHFCQGFKSRAAPRLLHTATIIILLHTFTCVWIYIGCSGDFPLEVLDFEKHNVSIDYGEWLHPVNNIRKGGCARTTSMVTKKDNHNVPGFVVPRYWANDYIVAFTYVILIHTRTNLDIVLAVSKQQVYYKIIVTYLMYLLDMWLLAIGISTIYTKFRELYQYDFLVNNLITFLEDSGLCPTLSKNMREYSKELWQWQKGNWLPELAYEGPVCLREDLFAALYMHHLDATSIFHKLPYYFKRQLVARLERIVIFPGKCIVREGDMFNVIYFIHEGEVEKWSSNGTGEYKMMSLLYTNGYFGCNPGLFANAAFRFSYYTRTVVDLVCLKLEKWRDLLEGYPAIKKTLYESTKALKHDAFKTQYQH